MHDIVGWAWPSAHAEHGAVNVYDCHQNVPEPPATEYHKKVHTYTQTVSQA